MSLKLEHKIETSSGTTNRITVHVPLHAIGATSGDVKADSTAISTFTTQIFQANTASATSNQTTSNTEDKPFDYRNVPPPWVGGYKNIHVLISGLGSPVYRVEVAPVDTVETVKKRSFPHFGLGSEECKLYWRDTVLEDDVRLDEEGIGDGEFLKIDIEEE